MAHELDFSPGRAAIAYAGEGGKPWHGLGQTMRRGASVDEWRTAAGLDWDALRSPVMFSDGEQAITYDDRHVLYRSDTKKPLSVVSNEYQIVQPGDILGFFRELAAAGAFEIETVGALREGRRIWALARIGENAKIMDDEVAPYLMLATSYDGTMATIAKFTTVRIVCNNTLQGALRNDSGQRQVTIPHSAIFQPDSLRQSLGIAISSWDEFMIRAGALAKRQLSDSEMDAFLLELIEPPSSKDYTVDQIRQSKGYRRIMALFKGGQLGAGQDAIDGTAWGAVAAVTEFIDHERGRLQDSRLEAAWFGPGARLKERAMELLEA